MECRVHRLVKVGYHGRSHKEEKVRRPNWERRQKLLWILSTSLTHPWPFSLLWCIIDQVMSPPDLQQCSSLQRLGNRGSNFGIFRDQFHPAVTSDMPAHGDLLKLSEQIPASSWAGEMQDANTVYSRAQRGPQQLHPQDKKSSSFNKDSRRVCEFPSKKFCLLHGKGVAGESGKAVFSLSNGLATDVLFSAK